MITGDDWPFTHTRIYPNLLTNLPFTKHVAHHECKQKHITVPQLHTESNEALTPKQKRAYLYLSCGHASVAFMKSEH